MDFHVISRMSNNCIRFVEVHCIVVRRMIPAYGTIILLTAHYVPHLYRGPFWAYRMWPEAERCKNYWWVNLLGVSNFVDAENEVSGAVRELRTLTCLKGEIDHCKNVA